MKPKPSAKIVRRHLRYDEETGCLWWAKVYNRRPADRPAGSLRSGYVWVKLFGHDYTATHLIWVIKTGRWPKKQIDHKDLNRANNRWHNLRLATNQQNICNKRARCDNRSGFKGVSWKTSHQRWCAQICVSGKVMHLGLFDSPEMAHGIYVAAAKRHFGEFARAH